MSASVVAGSPKVPPAAVKGTPVKGAQDQPANAPVSSDDASKNNDTSKKVAKKGIGCFTVTSIVVAGVVTVAAAIFLAVVLWPAAAALATSLGLGAGVAFLTAHTVAVAAISSSVLAVSLFYAILAAPVRLWGVNAEARGLKNKEAELKAIEAKHESNLKEINSKIDDAKSRMKDARNEEKELLLSQLRGGKEVRDNQLDALGELYDEQITDLGRLITPENRADIEKQIQAINALKVKANEAKNNVTKLYDAFASAASA